MGYNGPEPITFESILSYRELYKHILKPKDIDAIVALDKVYMGVVNKNG